MPPKKAAPKKQPSAPKAASRKKNGKVNAPIRDKDAPQRFPIVGLGASAGGLDALRAFFAQAPAGSGMAYVVIVHMTPNQPSMLSELLQKVTSLPVTTATDGRPVEADHIYVIAPSKEISLADGRLRVQEITDRHSASAMPIDFFLRSLAQERGRLAAAVILSGTGTDGTLGAKEVKVNEGLVLVQSEESAGYDGMPRSAISSGAADMILLPQEMPAKLTHYFSQPTLSLAARESAEGARREWLNKIFSILRAQVGHDFSRYKVNTLLRRISRRMGLNQVTDEAQYLRFLRENPDEVQALFQELLIGVTSFFRDADSFEALKNKSLPPLLDRLPQDTTVRAWVPGCSTGEEVYSLAMVLRELLDTGPQRLQLQLFGTDIDHHAIEKAREGIYPASIAADVSPERLTRFFIKEGDCYRVRKEIRDSAVFSVQDLIRDPPFSRLHLLCCRNLLIYLDGDAQKKLIPLFHYTLQADGILMLGSSETIGGHGNLFETENKTWKIFRRRDLPLSRRPPVTFPSGLPARELPDGESPLAQPTVPRKNTGETIRDLVLDRFAPTVLLVDAQGEIQYVQGRTGKYMEATSGPPTRNVLDMAREGLRIELSSAIRAAKSSRQIVLRRNIRVRTNGDIQLIDLEVHPLNAPRELAGQLMVVFKDVPPVPQGKAAAGDRDSGRKGETGRIAELEKELQSTRESHQTTIEELESSNEELKSTNEELQSSNEELQSTNEELESSKEELQSLNEELQTVNAELNSKVDELSAAHDDMRNLLNSTRIATIFVDNDLLVRRFTPEATALINLIASDIGRPLQHVAANLEYRTLIEDMTEVLETLAPRELEVRTTQGEWFKMSINPYRTMDNRIDGAVVTFVSIDEQKKTQQVLDASRRDMKQAWLLVRNVFDMNADPLVVLDQAGLVVIANQVFGALLNTAPDQVREMDIFDHPYSLLKRTELMRKLEAAGNEGKDFSMEIGPVGRAEPARRYRVHGRIIQTDGERSEPYRILLRFQKLQEEGPADA